MLGLHRQLLNQKGKSSFRYQKMCFRESIGKIRLNFFSEFLLEHHFVVVFFAVCRFFYVLDFVKNFFVIIESKGLPNAFSDFMSLMLA